jgi:CubicO group peptidase (beta-lactamase class C family)
MNHNILPMNQIYLFLKVDAHASRVYHNETVSQRQKMNNRSRDFMRRRRFLAQCGIASLFANQLLAALQTARLEDANAVLTKATTTGQIKAAVLHVTQGDKSWTQGFGQAQPETSLFLLGSISKPISVTALMTLFDKGEFKLDDPVKKYIPTFAGDGREKVSVRHLLTHVSGLPDQLAENNMLRKAHAGLPEFIEHAIRTPLQFSPGTRYQYSSMAILLAAEVAQKISGIGFLEFVDRSVYQPLGMKHSAMGLGRFKLEDLVSCQTEFAAPEAGAGDPTAKDWDWNSLYWRQLGAPWGGAHCSAPDLKRLMAEFLFAQGLVVKPETAKLMLTNHNGPGIAPRGLGWNIGAAAGSSGCSEKTFGHTGSTGTLAWADAASQTICVVLTSLPARAVQPHPRDLAAAKIAG